MQTRADGENRIFLGSFRHFSLAGTDCNQRQLIAANAVEMQYVVGLIR
jgi:hypothetical protein